MFKSKKSNSTISPLQPPPASTNPYPQYSQQQRQGSGPTGPFSPTNLTPQQQQYYTSTDKRDRRSSAPLSGVPYHMQEQSNGPNGFGSDQGSMRGRPMSSSPGQGLTVPSPVDLRRISTGGTTGTSGSGKSGDGKKEKRRSGFFGFGKKNKDRDTDKDSRNRPTSFSVERPAQDGPAFSRHTMSSIPSQLSQSSQPFEDYTGSGGDRHRTVSQPGQGAAPPNEFGGNDGRYPKSQSMAFGGGRGVRDGPQGPDGRQGDGQGISQMTKSQSMPFNKYNERGQDNAQPAMTQAPAALGSQRGYGGIPEEEAQVPTPIDKTPKQSPRLPPGQAASPRQAQGLGTNVPTDAKMQTFDQVVELIAAQPQKTYVASPPELEMILARTSAGGQPKQGQPGSASNDWDSVWLQLSGISLSMWSMKETRAAAAKGEKVPPTYFNITDSSIELLAPLPPPPHRPNSHPHHFVFSLNTAGSNRLLFSCPSERDMAKWATGLRLAAWERARLEEIYTGHLIKSEGQSETPTRLRGGRMEGWVRARVMGGTDWKRLWVVLSTPEVPKDEAAEKKNRRRSIFGIGESKEKEVVQEPNTGQKMATFYLEPRTQKNQTSNVPVLTITNVSQVYAVFPERLEVMSQSNLMKVVGRVNGELVTIEGRLRDSGWALIMPESPETPGSNTPPGHSSPLNNMLRWITGFHDVFELYGRPAGYNWDVKDPKSLFFAYPRGENRSRLFLDIDEALRSDFRTSSLAQIRTSFASLLQQRMNGPDAQYKPEDESAGTTPRPDNNSYRLPPLAFDKSGPAANGPPPQPRSLTPITERTDIASRNPSQRTEKSQFFTSDTASTAQHRQVSKQTSGGSSKQGGSIGDDRLATISDGNEAQPSQITDTAAVKSPVEKLSRRGTDQSTFADTPVTYQSQSTNWSQSSAATQAQRAPTPPGEDADSSEAFHTPQPGNASTVPSSAERDLPDLPGSWNPQARSGSPLPTSESGTPLAAALSSAPPPVLSPTPRRGSVEPTATTGSGYEQAAAAYLANVVEKKAQPNPNFQRSPEASHTPLDMQRLSEEKPRPTIVTQLDNHERRPSSGPDLGRRPSGARPLPVKQDSTSSSRILQSTAEAVENENGDTLNSLPTGQGSRSERLASTSTVADLGEDAANFMAYAEQPSPAKVPSVIPIKVAAPAAPRPEELRSSFAPSKAATERKAQAEQTAAAKTLPGAGKRTGGASGAWSDGSDEEDEEESEEESEVTNGKGKGKGVAPSLPPLPHQLQQESQLYDQAPVQRVLSQTRALPAIPAIPRLNGETQPPNTRDYDPQRTMSGPDRNATRSRSPAAPLPQPPAIYAQPAPPPATRQTIWNANFSADHGLDAPKSGKFVDIDEPAQLTKAFAPHGLLQAGMQDKEDRSAKKQEELARGLGSSLVNVPEKPPPPQTGLLGAVAQHEKERRNAGGIGATITDRERERRLAEDRQREIEKRQRQQAEHMRSFNGEGNMGMYGGSQQFPPYMNMGMMGMPPMGYNPYQSGHNPYAQHQAMMAAQMAYQQAMMSYGPPPNQSQFQGSQAGDHDRPSSPSSISNNPYSAAQSPGAGAQPYSFFQGYGGWPGMSPMPMGWGTPSPPPSGAMPPWMQSPGFGHGGPQMGGYPTSPGLHPQGYGQDGRDARSQTSDDRSRVQSMVSEGQGSNQGYHPS